MAHITVFHPTMAYLISMGSTAPVASSHKNKQIPTPLYPPGTHAKTCNFKTRHDLARYHIPTRMPCHHASPSSRRTWICRCNSPPNFLNGQLGVEMCRLLRLIHGTGWGLTMRGGMSFPWEMCIWMGAGWVSLLDTMSDTRLIASNPSSRYAPCAVLSR